MMNAKNIVGALAMLACTSGSVLAGQALEVKVKGTITPAACDVEFVGDGTVNYENISPLKLKHDAITALENKQVPIRITCQAPTKVSLRATDYRADSVAGIDTSGAGIDKSVGVAGLGFSNGKSIGVYTMGLSDLTVSSNAESPVLVTKVTDDEWARGTGKPITPFYKFENAAAEISVADTAGSDIISSTSAFTNMNATINVQAYINKTSELTLSSAIELDGLSTITLHYL